MPYLANRDFETDADDKELWRYMDFTKFASLVLYGKLFMPSLRLLRETDPYEGRATEAEINMSYKDYQNIFVPLGMPDIDEASFESLKNDRKSDARFDEAMANFTYISCWHQNSFESDAMWKVYNARGDGVAIQTTVGRLKEAIASNRRQIMVGRVDYVDMKKEIYSGINGLNYFLSLRKSKSYEHEREVRMVALDNKAPAPGAPGTFGLEIEFDLIKGIEKVLVSPTAPGWVYDLIKALLSELKLPLVVEKSAYLKAPSY